MNQLITNRKMQNKMTSAAVIALFLIGMLIMGSVPVSNATIAVTPGYLSTATIKAELKYRNLVNPSGLQGYEGIMGVPIIPSPYYSPQAQNDFYRGLTCDGSTPYGSWQASNHVKFTYDPTTPGILSARVDATYSYCMVVNVGDLGTLNYLQFAVVNRGTGTTVNFKNVVFNTNSLGDFTGSDWSTWYVTGLDFTSGFTIEGDLQLVSGGGGQETNKLVISVGALPQYQLTISVSPPSAGTTAPVVGSYLYDLGTGVTVTATPASGYTFDSWLLDGSPAGSTNPITVTMNAPHNLVAQFLSPNAIKSSVRQDLITLRDSGTVTDKGDLNKLDEAIKHLTKSLEPELWVDETRLDPKHGEKVFQEEKDAVVKLLDLMKDKKSTIPVATLQGFINRLASADRLLASAAIHDAVAASGDTKKIDKANEELSKGDARTLDEKFVDAIEHYRNAWKHAIKAV